MYTFLFIVSFILHAISFFVIILLYYRLEQTREIERKQGNLLKDMEDVLSAYVLEMKEENEQFLIKVKSNNKVIETSEKSSSIQEYGKKNQENPPSINTVEPELTEDDLTALLPKYEKEIEVKVEGSKRSKEEEESLLQLLPIGKQAKMLQKKGLSVEEIAKKLNKGVTEIELFLKFNE